MKKLSVEQKVKAYDEALERAKGVIEQNPLMEYLKKGIEYIFPELKEGEDDKIKKSLLDYLYTLPNHFSHNGSLVIDWIAWLEKQGEQKPADKVKPNFHFKVGQWIVATGKCVYLITKIDGFNVTLVDTNGNEYVFDASSLDDTHEWTIADAKDGDVLASEDKVFIYNGKFDLRGRVCAYCGIYKTYDGLRFTECAIGNYFTYKEPHPATKEQRDLLFQKMKEVGYEWDDEKKELKKIVAPKFNVHDCIIKKHNSNINDFGSFVITDITGGKYWYNDRIICNISEQDDWELVEQKSTIWTKRDENEVAVLEAYIFSKDWSEKHIDRALGIIDELVNKIKSLSPQNRWKPSDEQMGVIEAVINNRSFQRRHLDSLYEQLKKLREE